jgi:hypothetical protein
MPENSDAVLESIHEVAMTALAGGPQEYEKALQLIADQSLKEE